MNPAGFARALADTAAAGAPEASTRCQGAGTAQALSGGAPAPPQRLSVVDEAMAYVRGERGPTTHMGLQLDGRVLADEIERVRRLVGGPRK